MNLDPYVRLPLLKLKAQMDHYHANYHALIKPSLVKDRFFLAYIRAKVTYGRALREALGFTVYRYRKEV